MRKRLGNENKRERFLMLLSVTVMRRQRYVRERGERLRETDRQPEKERQTDRQTVRERERDRQTDRQTDRQSERDRFSRFSENSFRFSEKSFRFPRIVLREQIFRLEIREEKIKFSRLVLGNGNGKTMVFNLH
jgi:hypothetical protein